MRWFLFSQTNIAPPLIPVINRGNQEQAGERSGHGNLPMPGSWEMGTAGKGTTAPCMAQKGPRDFLGGNPPGKATGPKQRRGSHSTSLSSLIRTGCSRLCPHVPQAGQQHQGGAHAMGQLSCVPVTPFCHWDASAANSGADYLLAMAPLRAHHVMARRPLHIHI